MADAKTDTKTPQAAAASASVFDATQQSLLIAATERFVAEQMANNDGSHDWSHIDRVRKLALRLMAEETASYRFATAEAKALWETDAYTQTVVVLAALLHDVKDWKYIGAAAALKVDPVDFLVNYFKKLGASTDHPIITRTRHVIQNIGFKDELDGGTQKVMITPELAVVQDADRLDAIGASGIARCFMYGGKLGRPLYTKAEDIPTELITLTKEQYIAKHNSGSKEPVINHFYEKLLHIKYKMKTAAGKIEASGRHADMLAFLESLRREAIEG